MANILSNERLRKARKRKGWSRDKLADEYSETYPLEDRYSIASTIKNWELGTTNPNLKDFVQVCDLLECDVDYMLGRLEEHTHTNEFIHDQTGLSEDAIDRMLSMKKDIYRMTTLDFLLRSQYFQDVLLTLYVLASNVYEYVKYTNMSNEAFESYVDSIDSKIPFKTHAETVSECQLASDKMELHLNKLCGNITDAISNAAAEKALNDLGFSSVSKTFKEKMEAFEEMHNFNISG